MTQEEKQEFKQLIREVMDEYHSRPIGCVHEWEVINQYSVTSGPHTRCRRCGAFMTTTTGAASGQTPVRFTWPNTTSGKP